MAIPVAIIDACQTTAYYNYCLMDALAKKGVDTIYLTTRFPYEDISPPEAVRVRYFFFQMAQVVANVTSSRKIRRILRGIEYPIDVVFLVAYILIRRIKVVHIMNPVFPTVDYWAMRLLQNVGCRVVFTAHNPLPHEEKPSSLRKYSRMYHAADVIIALTNFTRNEIVSCCGVSAKKISVIGHGDFSYVFSRYPCNKELAGSVRRAARQRHVVSFLGHIRPYKGLKYFAQAFGLIKQQVPDSFFLVAGSLLIGNKKELTKVLSQSCEADDLWCDIRFIPTPDMKAYLSVTDVLVQPYVTASQSGNTVMAYAQGIPVISTDVGGLGEMTEDGETGFVVPPKDPQALADAVKECLVEDTYARMSENARQMSAEKYSWDSIATQTLAVYSLLGYCEAERD